MCVCLCLDDGHHGDKQSILVTNCGGGRLEWVHVRTASVPTPVRIHVRDLRMIFLSVCLCVSVSHQDVQTDIQHGRSDLSSHRFDSSEGKDCFVAALPPAGSDIVLLYLPCGSVEVEKLQLDQSQHSFVFPSTSSQGWKSPDEFH